MLGTVLGVLPGTVAVVVLGDAAVGGNPHPAMFAVSLVCGARSGWPGRGPAWPAAPARER